MSRLLLDTSAYSAIRRGDERLREPIREAREICLSPIVLGELRAGFLKGDRPAENEARLQEFLASPRCRVPAIDEETAHRYGGAWAHPFPRTTSGSPHPRLSTGCAS